MVITEIANCKGNKNRVNIYVDGAFAFALYLETAAWAGLFKGMDITDLNLLQIASEDEKKYAMDVALKYIAYQMRTLRQVQDKLKIKGITEGVAQDTIQKLQEIGYINDKEFAATYADELKERMGSRGIRQKLFEKGIRDAEADEALSEMGGFEDVIRSQAEKLMTKYADEDTYKRRQKVFRALLNRGFEVEEIKSALSQIGAGIVE